MRPRWQSALLLITFPIWFVPALIRHGWIEGGRDEFRGLPRAARYVLTGRW